MDKDKDKRLYTVQLDVVYDAETCGVDWYMTNLHAPKFIVGGHVAGVANNHEMLRRGLEAAINAYKEI